ncbi:MAG TPA: hypothetical protein VNT54_02845 [Solirubrobacteraceae bacterium]|nr:hypothetical protein [Solirubrobacteraceae bacterium]
MFKRSIAVALIAATAGLAGVLPAPAQAQQTRVSPNYKLASDPSAFRGRDGVGLAVNPNNPQHVVAVHTNYLESTCEASASFDGGATWSGAFTLTPPAPVGFFYPPVCNSSFGASQYIEFGSGQSVYTTTAMQKRQETLGFSQDASALVFKSNDGGVTWQEGVVALEGGPGGPDPNATPGPIWYRPSLSVHRGGGTGGADRVHVVSRNIRNVACSTGSCSELHSTVSNDGGASFAPPVRVTPEGVSVQDYPSKPVVNSDGSVTVAWRTLGIDGLIQTARSTDGGQSWQAAVDVTRVRNTGSAVTSHIQPPTPTPGVTSTSASYPRMAGDPNIPGRLYLVYSQGSGGPTAPPGGYQGSDHFISPDSAVWFQRSTDGGLTWSTPKRVSDATNHPGSRVHQTRHPSISVSSNGRINIVWHDRRHWYQGPGERMCSHSHIFCEDIRLGDTYYDTSTDGGLNFGTDVRVNDRSHNNEVGYDTRPSGYWWFAPQSVGVGNQVLVGWMDSREGNWDTDTEDIYLAKVDFGATGEAPRTHVDAGDAVARSVELSKLGYMGGNEGALVGGPRDPAGAGPTGPASRNASHVVIVNQNDVAGALAGAVLGRANPAPVLLSPAAGLPASVKAELARLNPAGAYIIGDATSLSAQVQADLVAAGIPSGAIERLAGGSDAGTAALIASEMDRRLAAETSVDAPAFDAAVIANPASAESAAVAGMASARRLPVLYTNAAGDAIPASTSAALTALDIDKTLVIGSTASVSAAAAAGLPNVTRLGGANVYATSQAVLSESVARGLPTNVVYVADGAQPMDAALLGGVVGRATGVMVLAPAPLYDSAVGQVSAFGLSGISRYFLVGPASAPPPPPPASDTTAPVARLLGPTIQKLRSTVSVTVLCSSEPCRAIVNATIRVPKLGRAKAKTLRFRSVSANLRPGVRRTVRLRVSSTSRSTILRALRLRKGISVRVAVRVSDAAGNRRTLRRTVRLKR